MVKGSDLLGGHGFMAMNKVGKKTFRLQQEGRTFLCKMIDDAKEDTVKEAKLIAELQHPFIVRIHYHEIFADQRLCIVMDYCPGGDLAMKIKDASRRRRSFPEDQILSWFMNGISAVKYIHEKNVLHGNLNPGSFFLTRSGMMKMGNFCLQDKLRVFTVSAFNARAHERSPNYLSPELCKAEPCGFSSEIWAMGCILFELCALKKPFDAPNILSLVRKVVKEPLEEMPRSYSDSVKDLLGEMLNKSPDLRPSAAAVLSKPCMQRAVMQLLAEVQDIRAADANVRGPEIAVPNAPAGSLQGPYSGSAGSYAADDLVEYHSVSHEEWLPGVVVQAGEDGRIIIDRKPNVWISLEEQATKVRPAQPDRPIPGRLQDTGADARTPLMRSPAIVASARAPSISASRAASPSRGALDVRTPERREPGDLYRKGDLVEYWSETYKEWLPAVVINTNVYARIVVDLKPNTWMSQDEQAAKVRRRSSEVTPASAVCRGSPPQYPASP